MRHRKFGRRLGRSSPHKHAMLRNLASSLILTERDADELEVNKPKVKGRVVTTLAKAKEVRPLLERCITIARKALSHLEAAEEFETSASRNSGEWKAWRKSARYKSWSEAMAPALTARRRCIALLGDRAAVRLLFAEVAPRFRDRNGGYTRVLRLAKPRLGDAGTRVILEFVGVNDRTTRKSSKPVVEEDSAAS